MFIFLLIMVVLTPIIMMAIALLWKRKPPKDINGVYGYRTKRSMKNQDTWNFAHKYCAKIWLNVSVVLFVFSVGTMFIFKSNFEIVTLCIVGIQVIILCITIIQIEIVLKNNFDENGL